LGNFLAILAALSQGIFFELFTELTATVPPIFLITIMAASAGLFLGVLGLAFFPTLFTLSLDWHTGVFGFLSSDQLFYILSMVGFFTGSLQYVAYAFA